jgi:hypothetical protein
MRDIDLNDIIFLLGPNSGQGLVFNIFIYLIFFFTLVTMLLQGDKALLTVILCVGGLLMCLVDKLDIFEPKEFGAMILHAGMFIFPALVAGMTKDPKSRAPAVFASILGAVYFFVFWLILQRT